MSNGVIRCEHCGDRVPPHRAKDVDISTKEEYYPKIIHFCPGCIENA